jgi:hypothetical protein
MKLHKKIVIYLIIIIALLLFLFILSNHSASQTPRSISAPAKTISASLITNQPILAVGKVSRHVKNFINKRVRIQGYLAKKESTYVIVSDETAGLLGYYDLPISGTSFQAIKPGIKYILEGTLLLGKIKAVNGNLYRLELSTAPIPTK